MTVDALDGTSVVVVGGSSGIGLATARLAAEHGASVTIVGRDPGRLADAATSIGADVRTASLDVADEPAVRDLFTSLHGVHHVVDLAGTHVNGTLADLDVEAMRGPVDDRFWGAIHLCKHAPPAMTGDGDRSITICTGAGVARPRAGAAIVAAAAGGAELVARSMALELSPIRVNVIRPCIVDTPLLDRMTGGRKDDVVPAMAARIPVGRVARPEEIADAIAFLMTNAYVTGSTLTIDGGHGLVEAGPRVTRS